jgi:hypothetical protein
MSTCAGCAHASLHSSTLTPHPLCKHPPTHQTARASPLLAHVVATRGVAPCDPEPPRKPAALKSSSPALATHLPVDPRTNPTRHRTNRPAWPTAAIANAGVGTATVTTLAATARAAALAARLAAVPRRQSRATNCVNSRSRPHRQPPCHRPRRPSPAARAATRAVVALSTAPLAAHAAAASAAAAFAATHAALTQPTRHNPY